MINKKWAGHIYGTNTGNIYIEFEEPVNDASLIGTLSILDNQLGAAKYALAGTYTDSLILTGTPTLVRDGVEAGSIWAQAKLTSDGNLRGDWKSEIGTAGTFVAYPHGNEMDQLRSKDGIGPPEQLFTARKQIGALRLYAQDIAVLAQVAKGDFSSGRAIVTYSVRGSEVTRYLEDFTTDAPNLGELRKFKFHIQEPDAHGVNKVVTIDLNTFGSNDVTVQGVNESWVVGKLESIARALSEYESALVTNYKKFGLSLNQSIFLAMLVFIPAIEKIWHRATFVVGVILLLQGLYWIHSKFIPILVVYPSHKTPTFLQRMWPSTISWLIAATSALAASFLYAWMASKP